MKPISLALLASVIAAPVAAQDTRQMEAHVHGVSTLELAVEGAVVEIDLTFPGMDIVGFEYSASKDADKAAVEAALRTMLVPENIVMLSDAAECRLTEAAAHLNGGAHDHDDAHDDDHAEGHDEEHDDGHDHDSAAHAEKAGHDHDHEPEHDAEAQHSEFHVAYVFECAHTEDLTTIGFPFFAAFPNAQEIEAQFVTEAGAGAAEIGRAAAELGLN